MALTNEPIIILGAFRSGTSCLATALAHLGVHMGEERDFLPADQFNEGGYQELEEMQMLNARCLAAFGMNYFQAEKLPDDWQQYPGANEMVAEIQSLLRKHFDGRPLWGWKEPSTTILLPLVRQALQNENVGAPRYPISIRHPLSVAASQKRRQAKFGFQEPRLVHTESEIPPVEQRTVGLWMHYTLSALRFTQGSIRQIFSYENFLSDPLPYLEVLTRGMMNWTPSSDEMRIAADSVDPSLSHSKYGIEDLENLPVIVARAYDCCLRAEKDPDGLNSGKYDAEINALWEEWIYISQMTKPMFLPFTDMFVTWKEGRTNVKYTVTGTWQIVRAKVDASSGSTVQLDPSPLPCQIWIKRASWYEGDKERRAVLKQGINGILEDFGMMRLSAYGPCPLITQTPSGEGPYELELEMMVVNHPATLIDIITRMRMRLDQATRGPQPGQRR